MSTYTSTNTYKKTFILFITSKYLEDYKVKKLIKSFFKKEVSTCLLIYLPTSL